LLLRFLQATPEQQAAIERVLGGQAFPDCQKGALNSLATQHLEGGSLQGGSKAGSGHVFRRTGRYWEVIFGGGGPFHLENTLGARYLDHLLHHPNDPISAFDLEVAIQPEKGEARSTTSIQARLDPRAKREYGQALHRLRADRKLARKASDRDEASRLDGEIKALKERGGADDTGERARGNVREAIDVVVQKLLQWGNPERAFAEHIRERVSMGYECIYSQPQGRIWA
jgi:hypothetical protein